MAAASGVASASRVANTQLDDFGNKSELDVTKGLDMSLPSVIGPLDSGRSNLSSLAAAKWPVTLLGPRTFPVSP